MITEQPVLFFNGGIRGKEHKAGAVIDVVQRLVLGCGRGSLENREGRLAGNWEKSKVSLILDLGL
jgi:hypothetical protein